MVKSIQSWKGVHKASATSLAGVPDRHTPGHGGLPPFLLVQTAITVRFLLLLTVPPPFRHMLFQNSRA